MSNQREYSQVPTDGDRDENTIELTEFSQSQLLGDGDYDDNIHPDIFHDEVGSDKKGDDTDGYDQAVEEKLPWKIYNRWEEPIFLSLIVTAILVVPTLLLWMYGLFQFFGKWYSIWPLALHLQFRLSISTWYIKSISTLHFKHRGRLRVLCSVVTLFEIAMCGFVYPTISKILTGAFFSDIDGTEIKEWADEIRFTIAGVLICWLVVILRLCIGLPCATIRVMKHLRPDLYRDWRPIYWAPFGNEGELSDRIWNKLYSVFRFLNICVFGVNLVCIISVLTHFGPWPSGLSLPQNCNSLDDTECALPFPSFHHMKPDASSPTGWRVDLKGMPPLRGGIPFHPKFLNELDGFSTMGPILFYMDGLKEAYENGDGRHALQGPEHIYNSVNRTSITFLIDVDEKKLIHHSAEIDYLDPEKPIVMMFPAEPLKHNNHYAVAVISATDKSGLELPRTKGMTDIMKATDSDIRERFAHTTIPAVETAAPWFSFEKRPESLQLLFDFVTISEESQLGPVRAARDIALEQVRTWKWDSHVHLVSVVDDDCNRDDPPLIARTIHLSLDVPSFLHHESRYSFLDLKKIQRESEVTIGEAKAIFQIPCSLRNQTIGNNPGKQLKAIVETGHGLFGNRGEVKDYFFQKMANDNGYIMMAMDWRGMSSFDLPIVIKTLLAKPDLFQAVRDNLIQGFVNKLCLQHFSQNGMLDLEEFKFNGKTIPTVNSIKSLANEKSGSGRGDGVPISAFYGISQGGILGGGYMSLAGKTNLIDRGILGVPGTPFALILTRSRDFAEYDKLLLLNLYNNRHVRIMLGVLQMAWDSTEASGFQARPVSEPIPRLLLQAGLGDPIVPTIAAESLARAMGASTLPGNPRKIFGVPTQPEASIGRLGPNVTISELMFEEEYKSLPIENKYAEPNAVHWCVRLDSAMIKQVEEFINTGRAIDPCRDDRCKRKNATC